MVRIRVSVGLAAGASFFGPWPWVGLSRQMSLSALLVLGRNTRVLLGFWEGGGTGLCTPIGVRVAAHDHAMIRTGSTITI